MPTLLRMKHGRKTLVVYGHTPNFYYVRLFGKTDVFFIHKTQVIDF